MPIYAYRCEECGFAKDVLQKISDPQLTDCPACGKSTFKKQLTAAGFQLKGTGWYVTDFRGGNAPATAVAAKADSAAAPAGDAKPAAPAAAPAATTTPSGGDTK
ncbi:FmdB family zinc ribbon protein [Pseudoduganella chitinolytica]|uniref:Zinc ribbon domain-containing protein n=1 Tax=Pseudoduganella chitinolytica TaxID=34070 RepID=A0ABY8B9X3_9BURK|nr:FmdB family zinc ribbon protein [Pseudoduganella chitinolytica]WEF32605.1 zinc ribbon domain-containing protein [Pseudoduganella chitinolytica]